MPTDIRRHLIPEIANPLAHEYGDRLEYMPKSEKLLLINVLSGGLHELEISPAMDEYSFVEYCHEQGMADDLLASIRLPLLQQFDEYDSKTVETILLVLAMSLQQ